jgi:hypothetical protein
MPIDLAAVGAEDERCRRGCDPELPENSGPARSPVFGPDQDEIFIQKILKLGIGVKLLTQQDAGPSASGVEIDDDELVFGFGFGDGLIHRAREPILGGGHHGERHNA